MNTKAIFSHLSDNWATPRALYAEYVKDGYFDPCPLNCETDNLNGSFDEPMFINPPYSDISRWVDFAIRNFEKYGRSIVLLVPLRTDTKWFQKLLAYGCCFKFVKGRLRFNDLKQSAPFPSVLIEIRGELPSVIELY